jgi:hypothetical protein
MSATTVSFKAILTTAFGSDYTQVWPNTLRADAAITALHNFYIDNSTESSNPKDTYYLAGVYVINRYWNDKYHVRRQNEVSLEQQFVEMFDELGEFLLAQSSDDLTMMTLRTGIARQRISLATDLIRTKTWARLAARLYPLMKDSNY